MESIERLHVAAMLEATAPNLDRVFGSGNYTIEKTGEYSALLTTKLADFGFTDDPRDFVAGYISRVPNVEVIQSPLDTWMKFLGEDTPSQSCAASHSAQLAAELNWVARIVDEILVDPARTRDAAWYMNGYNQAYNDWASGQGSWTEANF